MVLGKPINDINCPCGIIHKGEDLKKDLDIFSNDFLPMECGCGKKYEVRYEVKMNETIRYRIG